MRYAAPIVLTLAASLARADIAVTRQACSIIAAGGDGTSQDFGPELIPWAGSVSSGFFPACRGQASLATQWDASRIVLDTSASIAPGTPLVLTQSLVQVDIEFDLTAPAQIEVRYDVLDSISVPPPPYVFTTTRLVDLTTIIELQTAPGTFAFNLPPGPYRLEVQNILGNFENDLPFAASSRSIVATLRILPPCDIDFNNDDLFPDTQDIADLLNVFAGSACPTPPPAGCDSVDFNHDGLFPDTQDIADFLTAFAGGAC